MSAWGAGLSLHDRGAVPRPGQEPDFDNLLAVQRREPRPTRIRVCHDVRGASL